MPVPDRRHQRRGDGRECQAPCFCEGNIIPASAHRTASSPPSHLHDDGLGSCPRSLPGAHPRPGRPLSPRRCPLARRPLSFAGGGRAPRPLFAAGAGDEARAAPRGRGRREPPPRGRRERTGTGSSPRLSTPKRWPRRCPEPQPSSLPSLPPSPVPTSPPKPQEPPRPRFTRAGASREAERSGAGGRPSAAGTARGGSSPAASPPPHCHGRCRGPALTMLLGAPRAGGWDRGRVGERLQAALAGLQELQVLREKQRELVRAALAMPQRPAAGGGEQPLSAHSKEHRLEATLTALKEQLVRDGTGRPAAPGALFPPPGVLRSRGAGGGRAGGGERRRAVPHRAAGLPEAPRGRQQAGRCSRRPHRSSRPAGGGSPPRAGASGGARGAAAGVRCGDRPCRRRDRYNGRLFSSGGAHLRAYAPTRSA